MSLGDDGSFSEHHQLNCLEKKIALGYTIIQELKDAGLECGDTIKQVRARILELNKEKANLWLKINSKRIDDFIR